MTDDYAAANRVQRDRLLTLAAALSANELRAGGGGGWTASVGLAHLAFWDRRAAGILRLWKSGKAPPEDPEWYGGADLLNESLVPLWEALSGEEAVRLSLEACEVVDAEVLSVDPALARTIETSERDWLLNRWRHRAEHLDEIERALGR